MIPASRGDEQTQLNPPLEVDRTALTSICRKARAQAFFVVVHHRSFSGSSTSSIMRTSLALAAAALLLFFVLPDCCGATSRVLAAEGVCHTFDLSVENYEVSGVGLPTWQVRIANLCTNPRCSISSVIVHCGQFHTGGILVNPKVFRRLDLKQGTCIVNDGGVVRNADTVVFRYREIWKQPITFMSARIVCH